MAVTNVYDIDRVAPIDAPPEFADDVADVNFVPAPCQVACPIGTDAPSYIAYIWEGKIEQAFEAITATIPSARSAAASATRPASRPAAASTATARSPSATSSAM